MEISSSRVKDFTDKTFALCSGPRLSSKHNGMAKSQNRRRATEEYCATKPRPCHCARQRISSRPDRSARGSENFLPKNSRLHHTWGQQSGGGRGTDCDFDDEVLIMGRRQQAKPDRMLESFATDNDQGKIDSGSREGVVPGCGGDDVPANARRSNRRHPQNFNLNQVR